MFTPIATTLVQVLEACGTRGHQCREGRSAQSAVGDRAGATQLPPRPRGSRVSSPRSLAFFVRSWRVLRETRIFDYGLTSRR